MFCSKCGQQINYTTNRCPSCGAKLTAKKENEAAASGSAIASASMVEALKTAAKQAAAETRKSGREKTSGRAGGEGSESANRTGKKHGLLIAGILALVFSMLASAALVVLTLSAGNTYAEAVNLMYEGKYAQAIEAFQKLGGYEDSKERVILCEKLMQQEQDSPWGSGEQPPIGNSGSESSKTESSKEESKPESSKEESKPESSKEESKPESSKEESKTESSKEESKPESSREESKPESSRIESSAVQPVTMVQKIDRFGISVLVNEGFALRAEADAKWDNVQEIPGHTQYCGYVYLEKNSNPSRNRLYTVYLTSGTVKGRQIEFVYWVYFDNIRYSENGAISYDARYSCRDDEYTVKTAFGSYYSYFGLDNYDLFYSYIINNLFSYSVQKDTVSRIPINHPVSATFN